MKLCRGGAIVVVAASVAVPIALLAQGCLFEPPACELCVAPGVDVCVPAEGHKPPPDQCGLFVSSSLGADDAAGSKDAPLRSITAALARAEPGTRVYVCGELFEEALVVPPAVSLFGGLDCADGFWYAPSKGRTEILAPPGVPALTFPPAFDPASGATTGGGTGPATEPAPGSAPDLAAESRIVDVRAVAAASPESGASSIAALVDHAAVVFVRTTLVAADARDGEGGAPFDDASTAGEPGNPGADACTASIVPGGASVATSCADTLSIGGEGGDGGPASGEDGAPGEPVGLANQGSGAPSTAVPCTPGAPGVPGVAGAPGLGGATHGTIGPTGFLGARGHDGAPGTAAQGGGGGGGAVGGSAPWACPLGSKIGGASGGSGGAGGCGGRGGRGGQPGGSSIAVLGLSSTITFEDTTLVAGRGGHGGAGGPGQLGGLGGKADKGGLAVASLDPACPGGPGGTGGQGGRGGGGAGGHSLGVAFSGNELALHGANVSVGAPGRGGSPPDPGIAADPGAGEDGLAAATLEFPP